MTRHSIVLGSNVSAIIAQVGIGPASAGSHQRDREGDRVDVERQPSFTSSGSRAPPPPKSVDMDQKLVSIRSTRSSVVAGTMMKFLNSDPTPHNVFSPDNEKYNLGTWPQGQTKDHTFAKCAKLSAVAFPHTRPENGRVRRASSNRQLGSPTDGATLRIQNVQGTDTLVAVPTWHAEAESLEPLPVTVGDARKAKRPSISCLCDGDGPGLQARSMWTYRAVVHDSKITAEPGPRAGPTAPVHTMKVRVRPEADCGGDMARAIRSPARRTRSHRMFGENWICATTCESNCRRCHQSADRRPGPEAGAFHQSA